MFDLFKKDIKVGDKIKLYLTTSKELEGKVLSIGDNYVLLEGDDNIQNRIFDKLIGGWDIIKVPVQNENVSKTLRIALAAREFDVTISTIAEKLSEINIIVEKNPNARISVDNYEYLRSILSSNDELSSPEIDLFVSEQINNENKLSPLSDSQIWRDYQKVKGINVKRKQIVNSRLKQGFLYYEVRKELPENSILGIQDTPKINETPNNISNKYYNSLEGLKEIIEDQELGRYISPNAEIHKYIKNAGFGFAKNSEVSEIRFRNDYVLDNLLINELKSFKKGDTIPVICSYFTNKKGQVFASLIIKPNTVENLIEKTKEYVNKQQFSIAKKFITLLRANKIDLPILKALKIEIDDNINKGNDKVVTFPEALETSQLDLTDENVISNDQSKTLENARAYRIKKLFDVSEKLFLHVIENKHQIDSAVKDLADQYREQGKLNEAIRLVEKYFNLFEKKEQGYNFLYDLYTNNGELEKARQTLESYVATEFDLNDQIVIRRRGKAYARLGALALKAKKSEKAKIYFKKAEELDPNNKQLKNALSTINFQSQSNNIVGNEAYFDENLFESLVYGISPFLKHALENSTYEGLTLTTKEKKIFDQTTLDDLRKSIEKYKGKPEIRAKYYLTEAKILEDLERGDDVEFYKALAKYCNAMAKVVASEKGPVETIREYYLNAFSVEEEWESIRRQVSIYFETFFSNYSEIVESNGVGLKKAVLSINSQIYRKDIFWDAILELIINSKQATARLLNLIFNNQDLKKHSLLYMENKFDKKDLKISLSENSFIDIWKDASRKRKEEEENVESQFKSYLKSNNVEEITTAFITKEKGYLPSFINALDHSRVNSLATICELTIQYFNQITFEDKEYYFNNIESRHNELFENTNQYPSGFGIGSILPLSTHILNLIRNKHQQTILISKPILDIQIEGESIIDDEKVCEIQVSISNNQQSSKAGEIEIEILKINNDSAEIKTSVSFNQSLSGGSEPLIAKFKLSLKEEIIKQGAFDITVKCSYKELANDTTASVEKNFGITFYDRSSFVEIINPYADHAKSNIVESTEMFKGRNELIDKICATLLTSKSKGYLIYGQKRSGKSSVLWHLENNLNKSKDVFAIYFSTGLSIAQDSNVEANLYYVILTSIERKIRKLKTSSNNVPEIGRTNLKDLLANPMLLFYERLNDIKEGFQLNQEWKNKKIILIIDEFTYIYYQIKLGNIPKTFMQNWKAFVEDGGFSLVLSGQDTMSNFISDFQNEFAMFKTERLTYLETEPARQLIEEPIWDKEKNRSRFTRNSVDKILDLTACSPFYIQIICNELVRYMNMKKKPVLTPADIDEVRDNLIWGSNSLTEFDFENLLSAGDKNLDEIKSVESMAILKQIAIQTKYIEFARREDINCFSKERDDLILSDLLKRGVISEQIESPNRLKINVQLFKQWLLNYNQHGQ
jgi:tetratricopeptide (TPR) repeat protein